MTDRVTPGVYWGYTQVYAVYQHPVYFAGVYSPQLLYGVAYVFPNYPKSRQVSCGLSTSVMCQRLRLECCDASKFNSAHTCYLLVSYNCHLMEIRCLNVMTKVIYCVIKLLSCSEFV